MFFAKALSYTGAIAETVSAIPVETVSTAVKSFANPSLSYIYNFSETFSESVTRVGEMSPRGWLNVTKIFC